MLTLVDVILNIRDERRFSRDPEEQEIDEKVLKDILEAGRRAPTGHNVQPWHFIVVSEAKTRKRLHDLVERYYKDVINDSHIVIIGCADPTLYPTKGSNIYVIDTAIALQNIVVAAEAYGIKTCWVRDFSEAEVKELLKIPENIRVIAMIAMGTPRGRRPLEEIVHYEVFDREKAKRQPIIGSLLEIVK